MTERRHRASKLRQIRKRTPSGVSKKRYVRAKGGHVACRMCRKPLQGVKTRKGISASKKHAGRRYAGELCMPCASNVIKAQARQKMLEGYS